MTAPGEAPRGERPPPLDDQVSGDRVVLYASGDLQRFAEVVGDLAAVRRVESYPNRVDVRSGGGQDVLPRLVEFATACDVALHGVLVVPADVESLLVSDGVDAGRLLDSGTAR